MNEIINSYKLNIEELQEKYRKSKSNNSELINEVNTQT